MKILFFVFFLIALLAFVNPGDKSVPGVAPAAELTCGLEDPQYQGAESCKACHFSEHRSWKKTTMALAFESLKPGQDVAEKEKHGLDPKKDYTKDATCLPCHTTGYGKPGGYPILDPAKPWTAEETKRAKEREGVQCESCHGPGSLTSPFKKENEKYKRADILARGMIEPNAANCMTCHNDTSPTIDKENFKFDYESLVKDPEKFHKRTKLKHPH